MPEAAPEWNAWRHDMFGEASLVWHDGPEFEAVLARWADDPHQVIHMLALGLGGADPLAAQAVTVLARRGHTLDGIEGQLRDCLTRASGNFRVRVAEALFAITGNGALSDPVCTVLVQSSRWGERVDAAIALNAFPVSPRVVASRAGGVVDEEYLVRRHSAQTMLILAGRHATIEDVPDLWNLIKSDHSKRSGVKQPIGSAHCCPSSCDLRSR